MQVATLPYYSYPAFSMCHEDRILGVAHGRKELGKTQGQSEIPRPVTEVTCSTQVKFDLHLKRREWALKNCACFFFKDYLKHFLYRPAVSPDV